MDSSYLSELTGVFLDEVEEQLQIMDQEILKLEQFGEAEETIQSLFRAAHTLKGSSAAMGFEEMKQLTHEMEHILDQVRNRRLHVTNTMINLLFKCLDYLRMLKDDFVTGENISTEISSIVNELQRFAVDSEGDVVAKGVSQEPSSSIVLGSDVVLKAQEALGDRLFVYHVHVWIAAECPMRSARALIICNQLGAFGEVLHTHPSLEDVEVDEDILEQVQYLLASQVEESQVKEALLGTLDVVKVEIVPFAAKDWEGIYETADIPTKQNENRSNLEDGKRKTQTIRVDVERLEHLMNLVGELVIDQTRIAQVGHILNNRYTSDDTVDELGQISDHVSRVVGDLQESVMKVRMLPIEHLFNRFPRMVRDLAQSLNKDIDLIIEGRETELDRTVIEEIGDPLIHLIRNAVDHGIEPAKDREQKGKSPRGRLQISAAHEENQVVITVADDGAGIDPLKMRESGVRKGIITEAEAQNISDQEAVNLIFRPGFSTAAAVSDISGRGVGMDIVRSHIEKLSGLINIETKLGEGTQFIIKLPLTLAIITGLLIKLNEKTMVLPMSSVVEIVRVPQDTIQTINGDLVVVIRNQVLPVLWLHDYFHVPRMQQNQKHLQLVVVGHAEKRMALVVDELNGNQEIVVKSLGTYVGQVECISGATILGNGRVALILEVAGISKMTGRG